MKGDAAQGLAGAVHTKAFLSRRDFKDFEDGCLATSMSCHHRMCVVQCGHVVSYCLHAGRSETAIEYSVGFDADGIISALDCKAWCLAGAFLDLAWNDLYGVMTGLDQVSLLNILL